MPRAFHLKLSTIILKSCPKRCCNYEGNMLNRPDGRKNWISRTSAIVATALPSSMGLRLKPCIQFIRMTSRKSKFSHIQKFRAGYMPKNWYKPFMILQLLLLQDKTYVAETCLQVVWLQRKLHKSYGGIFSTASSPRGIITYQTIQIIYIFQFSKQIL